ncbi:YihY family inner membrane protein [Porticoccaceae bacterium]|nr:YihY family inner membrane protein [Porticoccaceae bacterium]
MIRDLVQNHRYLHLFWQFLSYLVQRFNRDGCRQSAAALTYMSLFAIVPMLTLMYSMFSLIPAFQEAGSQVEGWIFSKVLPSSGQKITAYLSDFSAQARKLSSVGAVILMLTSYLMLANIEKTFNHIWGADGGRRGLSGFLLYWAILSLGPLLLAAGVVMKTYLLSFRLMVDEVDALGIAQYLFAYLPWLLTWMALSLLFIAVPNCKVRARHAVFGALVTTVLFESAKALFGLIVAHSSYTNIYGAFAAIPLFLIWIYLLWMLILIGAEFVRSLETFSVEGRGKKLPDLVATLMVLWHCWQNQQRGDSLSDQAMVASGMDAEHWKKLRNRLLQQRVLEKTQSGQYVLIRDLGSHSLNDACGWLGENIYSSATWESDKLIAEHPWYAKYDMLAGKARHQVQENFSLSIEELFTQGAPDPERPLPKT